MYETGPCIEDYDTQASSGGYEKEPQRHLMEAMRHKL